MCKVENLKYTCKDGLRGEFPDKIAKLKIDRKEF